MFSKFKLFCVNKQISEILKEFFPWLYSMQGIGTKYEKYSDKGLYDLFIAPHQPLNIIMKVISWSTVVTIDWFILCDFIANIAPKIFCLLKGIFPLWAFRRTTVWIGETVFVLKHKMDFTNGILVNRTKSVFKNVLILHPFL